VRSSQTGEEKREEDREGWERKLREEVRRHNSRTKNFRRRDKRGYKRNKR